MLQQYNRLLKLTKIKIFQFPTIINQKRRGGEKYLLVNNQVETLEKQNSAYISSLSYLLFLLSITYVYLHRIFQSLHKTKHLMQSFDNRDKKSAVTASYMDRISGIRISPIN